MSRVLVVGDVHEPVARLGYMRFCKDLYKEWDCDKVVLIGDIVDWAAISFHLCSPEGHSPTDEFNLAFKGVQKWYKAFPNSQVYTAAAPPESNLRKLLWGETGSITWCRTQNSFRRQITGIRRICICC